ncbi:MAG: hypothetical protein HC808_02825 [Candidatus Competibacteraceae bacterium]|nr:hypothetical protein [Candidatus Competibacteraceae bacterium]
MSWVLSGCSANLLGSESAQRTYLLDAQVALGPAEFSSRKTLLVADRAQKPASTHPASLTAKHRRR